MGSTTEISWADATFNPWTGCEKVSPACDHCYAEAWAKRTGHPERWQGERARTSAANWRQPIKWNREAEAAGVRRRVFCASLADVFDNQVWDRWRDDLWHLIHQTPHLDWMLLTKRPQNVIKMLPSPKIGAPQWGDGWPSVWLGTTAEDRKRYQMRWPHVAAVPARVRFLSAEPLLDDLGDLGLGRVGAPNWVIAGGESGGHARPVHIAWVRSLRDQCQSAGVAFHYKQHGEWIDAEQLRPYESGQMPALNFGQAARLAAGRPYQHQSDGSTVIRVGKNLAGRTLDGRTWDEVPT